MEIRDLSSQPCWCPFSTRGGPGKGQLLRDFCCPHAVVCPQGTQQGTLPCCCLAEAGDSSTAQFPQGIALPIPPWDPRHGERWKPAPAAPAPQLCTHLPQSQRSLSAPFPLLLGDIRGSSGPAVAPAVLLPCIFLLSRCNQSGKNPPVSGEGDTNCHLPPEPLQSLSCG